MTRQEKLDRVDAYFAPRIAQRQKAYDQYNALVQARDAKVVEINLFYDLREEAERLTALTQVEPTDP